jgi:hypothetical protein
MAESIKAKKKYIAIPATNRHEPRSNRKEISLIDTRDVVILR